MIRLTLRSQLLFGLLLSLIVSLVGQQLTQSVAAFELPFWENPSPTPVLSTPEPVATISPTASMTPQPSPYVTLPGAFMLKVTFYQGKAPVVNTVLQLESGRLTDTQPGDCSIRIIDQEGSILYELSFQPTFLAGEPLVEKDEIQMLFVLPNIDGAAAIIVTTTVGEVVYELE